MAASDWIALCEERDRRYRNRKLYSQPHRLSAREIECIRWGREREIEALPLDDRLDAWAYMASWQAPRAERP